MKKSRKLVLTLLSIVTVYVLCWVGINSYGIAYPGERAVIVTLGSISQKSYSGFFLRAPFVSGFAKINVRAQKIEQSFELKTKDFQDVKVSCALTYVATADSVHVLYSKVGMEYQPIILTPLVESAIQETIGQNTALLLVTKQSMVQDAIKYIIKDQLSVHGLVQVSDVRLFKPKFSEEFEDVVEEKMVADQKVTIAEFETKRVEELAKQKLKLAKVDVEILKLNSQALKNPLIVQYELAKALQKWDGKAPETLMLNKGNASPTVVPVVPIK